MAPQAATADPYAAIATPVAPAPAAASSDNSDPYASIATPIPDGNTPSLGSKVWEGAKESMPGQAAAAVLTPPKDHKEELAMQFGGRHALAAYRAAAGIVGGLESAIKAPSAEYQQAKQDFLRGVHDATTKDYRNLASTSASLASDITTMAGNPLGPRFRELSEGARPGGNLATPVTKNVIDAATMAFLENNPFRARTTAATTPATDVATTTSKIEPAVASRAAKAGLDTGEPGLSSEAAKAQNQAAVQTSANRAIQNIAARHAQTNNLPAPAADIAPRDVLVNNGNALVDAGKADYQALDKYTDGKFTNAQQELKNAQLELQQKAGTTAVDTPTLEANVLRAQMNVDNLFDTAVEKGMPKDLADAARTKFRTGQATLDAGNAVRIANRATGTTGARLTNLNTLENRWTALYDSGRLQQAFGADGAKAALAEIRAARESGEMFSELPPTETQALQKLINDRTTTGKFGTSTKWSAVRDDFSKMPDRGARFSDVPKVEKFINNQVFYQHLWHGAGAVAKWGAGAVGVGALGTLGYEGAKALSE